MPRDAAETIGIGTSCRRAEDPAVNAIANGSITKVDDRDRESRERCERVRRECRERLGDHERECRECTEREHC
jgi:hypothetical protein